MLARNEIRADRTGAMACREASATMELPMSRQDIAGDLGLTVKTVSRTLTALKEQAAIVRPASRRITIFNRIALNRWNA